MRPPIAGSRSACIRFWALWRGALLSWRGILEPLGGREGGAGWARALERVRGGGARPRIVRGEARIAPAIVLLATKLKASKTIAKEHERCAPPRPPTWVGVARCVAAVFSKLLIPVPGILFRVLESMVCQVQPSARGVIAKAMIHKTLGGF